MALPTMRTPQPGICRERHPPIATICRRVRNDTLRELLTVVNDVIANQHIPVDSEAYVIRAFLERTLE